MAETVSEDTSLAAGGTDNSQDAAQVKPPETKTTEEGLKFDGMSEEERTKLARFKTQNDLGKSYLELERKLGASVVLPGKNAKQEDWDAFYKRLGRPDSPDGYELQSVVTEEGVKLDDVGDVEFRKQAHELGLTKNQAETLHKWWINAIIGQTEKVKELARQKKREASDDLRKEYGLDYDKKLALIGLVNRKFGSDGWIPYLNRGPGNDPEFLRFLIKIGEAISEETLVQGRVQSGATVEEREPGILNYPNRPEITKNRFRSVR
jgi:hypothetical protein